MTARQRHVKIWTTIGALLLVASLALFVPADGDGADPSRLRWSPSPPDPALVDDGARPFDAGADTDASAGGTAYGGYEGGRASSNSAAAPPARDSPEKDEPDDCECDCTWSGRADVRVDVHISIEVDAQAEVG